MFGGSTGTVVSAAAAWLEEHGSPDLTTVAIAPDLGERYLDTVYQSNWLQDLYPDESVEPDGRRSVRLTDSRSVRWMAGRHALHGLSSLRMGCNPGRVRTYHENVVIVGPV
jgi:N-(2-amino-2-carboxyethyl)-L-glutamate synthase